MRSVSARFTLFPEGCCALAADLGRARHAHERDLWDLSPLPGSARALPEEQP
jgi:hypothetical protein